MGIVTPSDFLLLLEEKCPSQTKSSLSLGAVFRFSSDCHWTDGNCYYFSLILHSRFPNLQIFYEPILGHFVAGDGAHFYDFNGEFFDYEKLILLDDIAKEDTL